MSSILEKRKIRSPCFAKEDIYFLPLFKKKSPLASVLKTETSNPLYFAKRNTYFFYFEKRNTHFLLFWKKYIYFFYFEKEASIFSYNWKKKRLLSSILKKEPSACFCFETCCPWICRCPWTWSCPWTSSGDWLCFEW